MGFNLSSIITGKRYIIKVTDVLIHFNGFITGCWKSDEEQFGGCNTISTLVETMRNTIFRNTEIQITGIHLLVMF